MPCFGPLSAYRPEAGSADRRLIFSSRELSLEKIQVPCGQCIGCRLERSRQWAIRCVHEASLYQRNCFITLTYAPEHLPKDGSLVKKHFQDFMKRLRKRFGPGVRYFHCGEYGERGRRPHYHACLFNFDFPDKELWSVRSGVKLCVSRSLSEVWGKGFCTVGDVTFESAAYVARYVTKKVTGPKAASHYTVVVDERFGEVRELLPEYTTMSRRPGIGRAWLDQFSSDVYPHDRVVLRGKQLRPPKYYDSIYEVDHPFEMEDIKFRRQKRAIESAKDGTFERLRVREKCKMAQFHKLKRGYESS